MEKGTENVCVCVCVCERERERERERDCLTNRYAKIVRVTKIKFKWIQIETNSNVNSRGWDIK